MLVFFLFLVSSASAADMCPGEPRCTCKWSGGKNTVDCSNAGKKEFFLLIHFIFQNLNPYTFDFQILLIYNYLPVKCKWSGGKNTVDCSNAGKKEFFLLIHFIFQNLNPYTFDFQILLIYNYLPVKCKWSGGKNIVDCSNAEFFFIDSFYILEFKSMYF